MKGPLLAAHKNRSPDNYPVDQNTHFSCNTIKMVEDDKMEEEEGKKRKN